MTKDGSRRINRSRWFMPLFCCGLGVIVLAASWLGGRPGVGV